MDMCYAWMMMGFIWEHRELRYLMDKHWKDQKQGTEREDVQIEVGNTGHIQREFVSLEDVTGQPILKRILLDGVEISHG